MTTQPSGRPASRHGAVATTVGTVIAVALLLSGCGHDGNKDPRKGRVITRDTSCLTSSCEEDWKVCLGPDLLVHIDGVSDHMVKDSRECAP